MAQTFEDLVVWQKAHQLTLEIYRLKKDFPKDEVYALTSQMRSAAYSVPSNIVEGYTKRGPKDKLRFYNISEGSLQELKYFVILASDLEYTVEKESLIMKIDEVGKMLSSYSSKIRTNS